MAKVLIVEDDEVLRSAYQTILGSNGFEVSTARSGLEGIDVAGRVNPDVILLDMMMPGTNGLEFLRTYQPKNHPGTKIIVFSNVDEQKISHEAISLGAAHYVTKSSKSPSELVDLINGVLQKEKTE